MAVAEDAYRNVWSYKNHYAGSAGKDFIATGDLVEARVLLQRAAESGDGRHSLAATYDPLALRELKVYGVAADLEMARTWYERAKHLGSAEAPRRLKALIAAMR